MSTRVGEDSRSRYIPSGTHLLPSQVDKVKGGVNNCTSNAVLKGCCLSLAGEIRGEITLEIKKEQKSINGRGLPLPITAVIGWTFIIEPHRKGLHALVSRQGTIFFGH